MNNLVVLVPNWARLWPDMQAEKGCEYASFTPLGGAPIYKHIISQYQGEAKRVRMVFLLAPDAPEIDIDTAENSAIEVVRVQASGQPPLFLTDVACAPAFS